MKSPIIIMLCLTMICVKNISAQAENPVSRIVVDKFVNYYNRNQADSVFTLFSREMKDALPVENTKAMLAGLKLQLGEINSIEFLRYQSTIGLYKTRFTSGVVTMNISIDGDLLINGLLFRPYVPDDTPKIERNTTKLILPFENEWDVVWGGDTKENNYHVAVPSQKNAFDFVIRGETGKSYRTNGQTNEDYYCFGQPIISPCDAEVVIVIDGVKDNIPGEMNSYFAMGNTVVLRTEHNEYIYLCHFKQHSIQVKEGSRVRKGELLGLCGNSGNSSEAHLHFHIQNVENMNIATGVKSYFENILVNGVLKTDYSPVKGERIRNIK